MKKFVDLRIVFFFKVLLRVGLQSEMSVNILLPNTVSVIPNYSILVCVSIPVMKPFCYKPIMSVGIRSETRERPNPISRTCLSPVPFKYLFKSRFIRELR